MTITTTLVYSQNKKDLIQTIDRLRLDSTTLKLEIKGNHLIIDSLKKEIAHSEELINEKQVMNSNLNDSIKTLHEIIQKKDELIIEKQTVNILLNDSIKLLHKVERLKADSLAKIITIRDIPDHFIEQGCSYYFSNFVGEYIGYKGDYEKNKIQKLIDENEVFKAYELIKENSTSCIAFGGNNFVYLMVINESEIFFQQQSYENNDMGAIEEIYYADGYKVLIKLNILHEATHYDDIDIAIGTMIITNDRGGSLEKEIFRICAN